MSIYISMTNIIDLKSQDVHMICAERDVNPLPAKLSY